MIVQAALDMLKGDHGKGVKPGKILNEAVLKLMLTQQWNFSGLTWCFHSDWPNSKESNGTGKNKNALRKEEPFMAMYQSFHYHVSKLWYKAAIVILHNQDAMGKNIQTGKPSRQKWKYHGQTGKRYKMKGSKKGFQALKRKSPSFGNVKDYWGL